MKKQFIKKGLCFFLIMTLFAGLLPMNAFAGWEDGIECEFCGGYRFDDWVCDDGPHCSDSSGASDCYYENHCAECLGPVENSERCDTCYACDDCINDLEYHCALCGACSEAGYEVCTDCNTCMNCQIEAGTHCGECGECLESGTQCSEHPFEMYQEDHCADCGLKCPGCGDECYLDEYYDIYCEEHEACVACAADAGLHCTECYGCYEDELCCGKCYECGQESGDHCPECGIHFDWCETGGEGTHCVECAEEFICEQCNGCTWCNGTEFCDECGFCTECCIENAQSENCSCGEYCIYSGSWEDHFCENCGSCFDEYEQCEYCGHCSDCCESETECSSGMCIENPGYEGVDKETIYTCYVTDKDRTLIGLVTVKDLLLAEDDETAIKEMMLTNLISVTTRTDQEEVARMFSKYNFLALPVVDGENRMVGIVTFDDAMDVMEEEATEDIEMMSGMLPSEKSYLRSSVFELFKNRIPWLMLMMVSATFTGLIINSFEGALAAQVALTAFIPMLMGTGGNSGSQSSVTVIRSLSLGELEFRDIGIVLWKEIRTSVLCGVALAVVCFVKIWLVDRMLFGNTSITLMVDLVVCLALCVTVVVAKIVGCLLPMAAKAMKLDPAVMASPFISTIVDALSLLVYFLFAKAILGV